MEEVKQDGQEVHETPEEEVAEEATQELTPEEIADLKKRAEVSSQNFERLKNEEKKRKALEAKVEKLEAQQAIGNIDYDDEGVSSKLAELTTQIAKMKEEEQLRIAINTYPALQDKMAEFEEYREEYDSVPIEKAAKLFVLERGLADDQPKRKGLEKGGTTKTQPASGKMSAEDVARLRTNNYKEYKRLLLAGKIDIA